MKREIIVAGLVAAALAAGGWWYVGQRPETEFESVETAQLNDATATLPAEEPRPQAEGGPGVDPLSLPALAQRELAGRDFTVGRVLAENEAYTRYYITYRSNDLLISGIMNVPRGAGPWPVLLLNHGYIDPAVYTNGRGLRREQDYLARRGYVVIHSDYRNHADSDGDPAADRRFRQGYAEDVINAIGAVRAAHLPYVDGERIGMLGHSMGGGVAWKVAVTQPGLVDVFVQLAPVSADERDNFEKWVRRRPETAAAIVAAHGEPAQNPEFWDLISPLTFFDEVAVPIMIHHGTADESVPLPWSERAQAALVAVGKASILHIYPGEPHEFAAAWPLVMQRTAAFFDEHVRQ